MTLEEGLSLIASITYKPGWVFEGMIDREDQMLVCTFWGNVPDSLSEAPHRLSTQHGFSQQALGQLSPTTIAVCLLDRVLQLEEHECLEWFRVGGLHIREPHPVCGFGNPCLCEWGVHSLGC